MSENATINTLVNAELPPSVDNAVENLTDKPTLAIGTTFSDIWYLVFGGISYLSEKKKLKYSHALEEFHKSLNSAIEQIPPEKKIDPSIQITAHALENSKYCIEKEELRNMFVSLISNSLNTDYQSFIHPSFAEILKQMSVLDAKIMKLLKQNKNSSLPICQFTLEFSDGVSFSSPPEYLFLEFSDTDTDLWSLAVSSLERLGLIYVSFDDEMPLLSPSEYDKFEQFPLYKEAKTALYPGMNLGIKKGSISYSNLGRSFTKVCIPD